MTGKKEGGKKKTHKALFPLEHTDGISAGVTHSRGLIDACDSVCVSASRFDVCHLCLESSRQRKEDTLTLEPRTESSAEQKTEPY